MQFGNIKMNIHICSNMPIDAELHEDLFNEGTWWYNKTERKDNSVTFGGTQIYYCAWCGKQLDPISGLRELVKPIEELE